MANRRPARGWIRLALLLGLVALLAPAPVVADTLTGVVRSGTTPVFDAQINLFAMPGFHYVTGARTLGDGRYTVTVAAGTYRVAIEPAAGPFVGEVIEAVTVSGTTTQNVDLEVGATVTGLVRDPEGVDVNWTFVQLADPATGVERAFGNSRTDGRFSLGAPPGTHRISIVPPMERAELMRKELERVVTSSGLDLGTIVLQRGVIVRGRVVDTDGAGIAGLQVIMDKTTQGCCPEFYATTGADGAFEFSVPADQYVLTANPDPPFFPARKLIDTRSGDVLGVRLVVDAASGRFVPDVPPRAARIAATVPAANGDVTVNGRSGAVRPRSWVHLVTLDTGHVKTVRALGDGSFSGAIFAPRGGTILIKTDPLGITLGKVATEATAVTMRSSVNSMAGLPGTMVRVPDPAPVTGQIRFGGGGVVSFAGTGLPPWTFEGAIDRQVVSPGGTLRVWGTVRIASPKVRGRNGAQVNTHVTLQQVAGPTGAGSLAMNSYVSIFSTPTGLPIERQPRHFNHGLDQGRSVALQVTGDVATLPFDATLTLPASLPAGHYRPLINFWGLHDVIPTESPASRPITMIDRANRRMTSGVYGPLVRVGTPAPPRLFAAMLMNTLSNGTRGVRAREDHGRFGIAPRILTQSETFIVPRVDAVSGVSLRYRLEPFLPTVSVGDQAPPSIPIVPFRFPSGSLTVRVRKPDGTTTTLGPAPFAQARMTSPVDPNGDLLDGGGGHITDVYELTTLDPQFDVTFAQDGRHVITMEGSVQDTRGVTWSLGGTYDVWVARPIVIDTAVLPGTPFQVGDVFNPGVVVSPPVPADVEMTVQLAPNSDARQMITRVVRGRANRFGYFHPGDGGIPLDQRGEYRADVVVKYRDRTGLLMSARTWGGVVAPRDPEIIGHGRRGIDSEPVPGEAWFFRRDLGIMLGGNHVPFPFHSGDVTWHQHADSAIPLVSFQDVRGIVGGLMRTRATDPSGQYVDVPLMGSGSLAQRAAVGELPLFSSRPDRMDAHFDPRRVDVWGYSYRSVQRPLVRVREEIGEDALPPPYWRFREMYSGQVGVGRQGDLPNDVKFQYAGLVVRGPGVPGGPRYGLYGSLFVLVPDEDPGGGTRTFPPFRARPQSGPIMTLKGRDIDLFMHLTGVRPGTVLETGDTFAVSGAVGPPLAATVRYTVTGPDGTRTRSGRANEVGYYYDPADDFVVTVPGIYTVDLTVSYGGPTSAQARVDPPAQGDVLGTAGGRFRVFVVPRGSPPLSVNFVAHELLPEPAGFDVTATTPAGVSLRRWYATTTMPGFVLDDRGAVAEGRRFSYTYDPLALARDFPNLDASMFGQAVDVITVTLYAQGVDAEGDPAHAATVLVLHGTELYTRTAPLPAPDAADESLDGD